MQVKDLLKALSKMNPDSYVAVCEKNRNVCSEDDFRDVVGYCEVRNSSDLCDYAYIIFEE